MKKLKKYLIHIIQITVVISVFFFLFSNINIDENKNKKEIKVGLYEYGSYYFFDKGSKPNGYYNDLLKLISSKLGFKYTYVNCETQEGLEYLKNGKIDLLFGLSKTPDRENDYVFTDHYIADENYAIYANGNENCNDLSGLNGLKFGYIKNEQNNKYVSNLLSKKNIQPEFINENSYEEAQSDLKESKVDFIVAPVNRDLENQKFNRILEFSCEPVYIAGSKGNESLINQIDEVLSESNYGILIYNKYYNEYFSKNIFKNKIILVLILFILIFIYYIIFRKTRIIRKRKTISENLKNDKYVMYYQPIINPKTNNIVGLESLLRMKTEEGILTPNYFLEDIEKSNMVFDISIWIIKKVLEDYEKIKTYSFYENNKLYISVNVSFIEIEDEKFIEELIAISERTNFVRDLICLEVVEKFKSKDISKIQKTILTLKEHGFFIAIDDFGVEYSNLDLLNEIDAKIIKLDKYFINDIKTTLLKRKIIEFVSEICKVSDKSIVCEGVENDEQLEIIKNIDYEKIYIQGFFYSKPITIEELEHFTIKQS
ncbi:EAL domain-containing protein [Paraclostridium bifermentans]|uniref:EAL domain-containing protein n=1 Tax=Paraclostridium bifermentans TaxID=1490 RepID=A0AA44II21_PARBF|nr:EAL domain-containing protein [Paraclostridium bifermentans]MBN8048970.1 EAL domain-containing protein [Paraclostridium bifermentans]NME10387.1 EAL domain-containing protein [Paraclostridium bifermentans]